MSAGEKRDAANHRRTIKISGSGWKHAAMFSEFRKFPDGTGKHVHVGNDFHNGHRGAARSLRGAKAALRHAERRTSKSHIEQSLLENDW